MCPLSQKRAPAQVAFRVPLDVHDLLREKNSLSPAVIIKYRLMPRATSGIHPALQDRLCKGAGAPEARHTHPKGQEF